MPPCADHVSSWKSSWRKLLIFLHRQNLIPFKRWSGNSEVDRLLGHPRVAEDWRMLRLGWFRGGVIFATPSRYPRHSPIGVFLVNTESRTDVKQLVARAQFVIEEVSKGFDPGNALESGVGQYPKVGVEFVNWFSQTHKFCFLVGQKT